MKETYYVGYDPQLKIWEVCQLIPDFPDTYWVFKTTARHVQDALQKGVAQFERFTAKPTIERKSLYEHLYKQGQKLPAGYEGLFLVEVPTRLMPEAEKAISDGILMRGYENQVAIEANGTSWKCIEHNVGESHERVRKPRHEDHMAIGM